MNRGCEFTNETQRTRRVRTRACAHNYQPNNDIEAWLLGWKVKCIKCGKSSRKDQITENHERTTNAKNGPKQRIA